MNRFLHRIATIDGKDFDCLLDVLNMRVHCQYSDVGFVPSPIGTEIEVADIKGEIIEVEWNYETDEMKMLIREDVWSQDARRRKALQAFCTSPDTGHFFQG